MTAIDADRRAALDRLWDVAGTDRERDELYHDDAVLEFPQSGERFEGLANFLEWRLQYPSELDFRTRRISGSGDVWVGEHSIRYDGGPWMMGVSIVEFRGDRVALERIYSMDPWEAPAWRARWRSATPAV
jgi:SnoaL-like domain